MHLRPYQISGKQAIYDAWLVACVVIYVLPTGGGKTVLFSGMLKEHLGFCVAIVHRQELVSQISLTLARYGVKHRIIGPQSVVRFIIQLHIETLGRSFYEPNAACAVAGVQTLLRRADSLKHWAAQVTMWVGDEIHHFLRDNQWGKAVAMFPNAKGLGVTANTVRADGKGLGRHADGVADTLIVGPSMRELIQQGYLTDYRIFAPPSDLDVSGVAVSRVTGDYNPNQLKIQVKKSHIIGDVVTHYKRLAMGKLGITFATDVEIATDIAAQYNAAGVPAAVVSAKTPDKERVEIQRRFQRRELLQMVNVDLFGEGYDVPALEVVSMARPTESYNLFCLDPETEILTPDGWKGHEDLYTFHEVIAYDTETEMVKTLPILNTIKRGLYKGENLYGIQGPHLDIKVSDKHTMIVKGLSNTSKYWQKNTAEKAAERKSLFRLPVAGNGSYASSELSESELHLLGWYLSDGTINKITNSLAISQAVNREKHLTHIRSTITACGLKFGEYVYQRKNVPKTHHDIVHFCVSKGKPRGTQKHLQGWAHLEKWLDKSIPECYDSLTREELITLLYTLNLGDGATNHQSLDYIKRTLTITCGINKRMADRIQALCVTRGLRCNIATPHYEGRSMWYILHIRDATTSTIAGTGVSDGKISGKKPYTRSRFIKSTDTPPEFMWCVENELGTLITRRNGKVAIVGNCQQFGRSLRVMEGKTKALVIDHVGNTLRHGLPDAAPQWTLDRRERRVRASNPDLIPTRVCTKCMSLYERVYAKCPYCGYIPVPAIRSGPEFVDGDLLELDAATLAAMRGEVDAVDRPDREIRQGLEASGQGGIVAMSAAKQHRLRQDAQAELRDVISLWGGKQRAEGRPDSESYRRFYFRYKVDVLGAQALGRPDAEALCAKIKEDI